MKLRIDFRIKEVGEDVKEEDARGISFGDEVTLEGMMDFFDRCRDATRLLFFGSKHIKNELELLKEEFRSAYEQERRKKALESVQSKLIATSNSEQHRLDPARMRKLAMELRGTMSASRPAKRAPSTPPPLPPSATNKKASDVASTRPVSS